MISSTMGEPIVLPRAYTRADLNLIDFNLLATAPAIPPLSSAKFVINKRFVHRNASGHTFNQGNQCGAVRFTGRAIG